MAGWQFRLIFLPETALLSKYDVLPPAIPQEPTEDFPWWADLQPSAGFEHQIDLILPKMASWSTSQRMWGQKQRDDAHVLYVDESKSKVEEIAFRIDANAISPELVKQICILARHRTGSTGGEIEWTRNNFGRFRLSDHPRTLVSSSLVAGPFSILNTTNHVRVA